MATSTGVRLAGDPAGYCVDADGGLVRRSLVAGRALDSLLADGPLEADAGLRILRSAALVLDSVRWSGRGSHGRLSPSSIVIDDNEHGIFVIGFGEGDEPVDRSKSSLAVAYMAPEVLGGAALEATADTYALGRVLFEVVTGTAPSRPGTRSRRGAGHGSTHPSSRPSASPDLPQALDAVFETALATQPEARYSTCVELLIAAEAAFSRGEEPASEEQAVPETAPARVSVSDCTDLPVSSEDSPLVEEREATGRGSVRRRRLLTIGVVFGVAAILGSMVALDNRPSEETAAVVSGAPGARVESLTRVFGGDGSSTVAATPASDGLYPSSAGANSVVRVDSRTGAIEEAVSVGAGLVAIEAGDEALWAFSAGDGTITKIDPATDEILETIQVEGVPGGSAPVPGLDAVWVVNARNGQIIEIEKREVAEGHSQSTFAIGTPPTLLTNLPTSVTLQDDAAWIAHGRRVVRVALPSRLPTAIALEGERVSQVALGGGSLWIGDRGGSVRRLDPTTLETLAEVNVGGFVAGLVWVDDGLWVSACDEAGGLIAVVDSTTDTLVRRSRVGSCSRGIDSGFGSIWVASPPYESVLELDPSNASILSLIPVNGHPVDLAVSERGVYVALGTD